MKILVLTALYPPHHAGTYDERCRIQTEHLQQRGHAVHILTSNHGLTTEQSDGDIDRRLWLNAEYGHPAVTGYRALEKLETHNHQVLRETLERVQPQLVHVYSLRGLSKSLMFGLRRAQLPTVYDVADHWISEGLFHDPWLRWWNAPGTNLVRSTLELSGVRNTLDATAPTRLMKGLDRLPEVYGGPEARGSIPPGSIGGFRFDRIYFASYSLKQGTMQAGFKVDHGEVIHPGIAAENYYKEVQPGSAPIKRWLVVADLEPRSGVMTALKAVEALAKAARRTTLSVCGRGDSDHVATLRSYVVSRQLNVEFLTVSDLTRDLAGVYRRHDAFLYTAEWEEPFSFTPLAAMAAGLPVIGADIGGAREILRPDDNALLYAAGEPGELAARMMELMDQPEMRARVAEAGQTEILSKYNLSAVTDRVEEFLATSLDYWQQAQ